MEISQNKIKKIEKVLKENRIDLKELFDLFAKNPDYYVNVRLTDGRMWYKALSEIIAGLGIRPIKVWKEVKHILHLNSLGPGQSSSLEDCDTLDLKNVNSLSITCRCTYNSDATKQLKVHLKSGVNEENFDTVDYAFFEIDLEPGAEVQKTVAVTPDILYLKVQVENQDTEQSVTGIDVWAVLGHMD